MRVKIFASPEEIADFASGAIADAVRAKPDAVLGLATGATPLPTYGRLIGMYDRGEISFRGVRTFNLDEYIGLKPDDPNSYHSYMRVNLFDSIDILPENTHVPDGCAADPEEYCSRYDAMIEECGGIDLQLLGLGTNGHIAFNEPAGEFSGGTHVTELTESTVNANSKYFGSRELMPGRAITMGIGTIMKAKKIILIASGSSKAEAVKAMIGGGVTPGCPASALQRHEDALILLDPAAAELLTDKEKYQ